MNKVIQAAAELQNVCQSQGWQFCFIGGLALQRWIRHVHIKDLRNENGRWTPVLTGEGTMPVNEIRAVTDKIGYSGFLSFEWEKKWHPSIETAELAVPHFANWFRSQWSVLGPSHNLDRVQGGKR